MDVIVRTGEFSIDYRMLETLNRKLKEKEKKRLLFFMFVFVLEDMFRIWKIYVNQLNSFPPFCDPSFLFISLYLFSH